MEPAWQDFAPEDERLHRCLSFRVVDIGIGTDGQSLAVSNRYRTTTDSDGLYQEHAVRSSAEGLLREAGLANGLLSK